MRIFIIGLYFISFNSMSAPFGTEMGMTKTEIGINSTHKEISAYRWGLKSLPKTSKLFESYVVTVTPKNGLCYLRAVGVDISTSRYGTDLKSTFDKINNSLKKKYIKGEDNDMLSHGSIWNEPRDYMMGLVKKERFLVTFYNKEKGSTMSENVKTVMLKASALSSEKGFITLDYAFDNNDACNAEINALEDDVF